MGGKKVKSNPLKPYRAVIAFGCLAAAAAPATPVPLSAQGAHPEAPDELEQYGQFVGSWRCAGQSLQPDGKWQKSPGLATWTWYYVLDGHAIQDVWHPATEAGPDAAVGTNLRIYDAEAGLWRMVWATATQSHFDTFRATYRDGEILMYGERPPSKAYGAHLARITFHNIDARHFDWKYESSGPADARRWREVARLSCDRAGEM